MDVYSHWTAAERAKCLCTFSDFINSIQLGKSNNIWLKCEEEKMSHPYLALYNERVLLILWTISQCVVVCSLIQFGYLAPIQQCLFCMKKNPLCTCLSICLSASVIISLWETLIFHLSLPLLCALHVSSSCWVWQPACLWFFFHLLLGFSLWFCTVLALIVSSMERKTYYMLSILRIVQMKKGGR